MHYLQKINFYTARLYKWAVFLCGLCLIQLSGCGKQFVKTTPLEKPAGEPLIRVALSENISAEKLFFSEPHSLASEEATYILDETLGEFSISVRNGAIVLKSPKRYFNFAHTKKLVFQPNSKTGFRWNGNDYTGRLTFIRDNEKWMAVNELPLSEYVKGVVPYEIPSKTPDYYQAVIAQAIAARTYAMYHINKPASKYFDVYADTRDQVYSGMRSSFENANKAVDESHGEILVTTDDNLIETQYHSTCGGMLEPRDEYITDDSLRTKLIDFSDESFNCSASPLYRWVETIEANDILKNLYKAAKISQKDLNDYMENGYQMELDIKNRLHSGRVEKVEIKINDKKIQLSEWEIRRVLTSPQRDILPSTFFFLKKSGNTPNKFYLIGAGYGHGRGLCQWGAIGQSLKGKDYREILQSYYPALKLKKVY